MAIKLNDTETIDFPTEGKWSDFYANWAGPLVDALGEQHDYMDREDAVSGAFGKLIHKPQESYGHVPKTEREWFNCILWQAKGMLSHAYESKNTRIKYHQLATDERVRTGCARPVCKIDEEVRGNAAFNTFYRLCVDAGINERDIVAYRRYYLYGEPSDVVAADLGMTTNNLYQKKFKIDRLLKTKGRAVFFAECRKCFLEAA